MGLRSGPAPSSASSAASRPRRGCRTLCCPSSSRGGSRLSDVPLAPAVSRPPESRAALIPRHDVKRGEPLVLVAGLPSLVVLGAGIGYVKIHNRAASKQANIQQPSPANSATSGTAQPVPAEVASPSNAPTEAPNASQAPQRTAAASPTPVPPSSVGEPSPTPPPPKRTETHA